MRNTRIQLYQEMFQTQKRVFFQNDYFTCNLFRYSTGVCAVELKNSCGSMIVLPFQGQQIWRAEFMEQPLTMKSVFDEPQNTTRFGLNYGGLLIHCGLTANGNPSSEDNYPLHGELPNAAYQSAELLTGNDENGEFIAISGLFTYRNSLEYTYEFEPTLKLHAASSLIKLDIEARNLRKKAMGYMYMAHINWLPIDGSRLVYSALKDKKHIEVYDDTFGMAVEHEQFGQYVKNLIQDPTIADVLDSKTQYYDPELCMFIKYQPDHNNMAHAMQVLPNQNAFYVGFNTETLPNAVRWFARTGDEDAIAFAIPSVTNHLGLSYNLKRNNVRSISAQSSLKMHIEFGLLDKESASTMETHIQSVLNTEER